MDDIPLTVSNVILTLKEFLIVWLSQVLYFSNIYPEESYTKRKSFDVIVNISRSPALQKYLEEFAQEFLQLLLNNGTTTKSGNIYKLVILLYEQSNNKVKEKYSIMMDQFIGLGDLQTDLSFLKSGEFEKIGTTIELLEFDWNSIYSEFRSTIFQHVQELRKRQANRIPFKDVFFKTVIECSNMVNLNPSDKWLKVGDSSLPTPPLGKVVNIGQVSTGFLQFETINEYTK